VPTFGEELFAVGVTSSPLGELADGTLGERERDESPSFGDFTDAPGDRELRLGVDFFLGGMSQRSTIGF